MGDESFEALLECDDDRLSQLIALVRIGGLIVGSSFQKPNGQVCQDDASAIVRDLLTLLELLAELKIVTGHGRYLFPSAHGGGRPMSENTLNAAFRRMGFGKEEVTAHGLRATASSLLNESGKWHPDAIERSLAHGDSNAVRRAYHRTSYWDERIRMAQWWSDYLDELRDKGKIIALTKANNHG